MSEFEKTCTNPTCKQKIRMSNNTGKWLPYNLDNTFHKCPVSQPTPTMTKKDELIELVDLEERMEHAASICTEIRSKVSELELTIIGGQVSK